ncbi:MAG: glutaredoxin [Candidatus Jacksonbacteria bacterium]|jgi:glutaredoxin 3|nr:glutaredoxin [Candidatus Jacksonbacteria bacterium]MBT6034260.1 glutaredoxin [Candidatus Jacksonbacteria bacterium]MBT6301330.1 glutaredoxin [Candidatus Jacksonbacteria bacterium]MBT6756972.1 glutaredoxin [Candidatus Jacksonbacteria bacterium]MBT6955253.1 glutaredoxin [Candidatus Jacksonbacteria bacterium]
MAQQPEKKLEMYELEHCPYCIKVRNTLKEMGIEYVSHSVPANRADRTEVEKISGQQFVPVLIDPNTDTMIADDDDKAIEYLQKTYG